MPDAPAPTSLPTPAQGTWAGASAALAARVNRRNRVGLHLLRVGGGLLGAAVVALLWRAFGPAALGPLTNTAVVVMLLGLGLLVGFALARCTTCGEPEVDAGEAAWALDRIARVEGRGLAAAVARGPAASEAAFAGEPLVAPPAVRLLPPRGMVALAAGALLGVLAVLVPTRADPEAGTLRTAAGGATGRGAGAGAEQSARAAESEARQLDARRDAARAAREALDLPPAGPLDPREVAERLADTEAREAAAKAAQADPALAEALADDGPSGEGLAGLLDPGPDNPEQAATQRRAAAAARARATGPIVPADRRDVVQRYLELAD